jgi:GNAT superfamily N-acetyltransferase
MIRYQTGPCFSVDDFIAVLRASGLAERRPVDDRARMQRMLDGANLIVSAYHGERLVGVARSLSDFAYCTYLSDLAVDRAYQRQGIGVELVRRTRALGGAATLLLFSAPAAVDYYPRVGFSKGHGFMLRPDDPLPEPR